ncbi:MAG: maltotransferase domain-containing protein [Cyclobacteriaceae bacterium]
MQTLETTKTKSSKKPDNSLSGIAGQQRVIIKNVEPQVDHNHFSVKRTVGESVDVYADIFADSHDKVYALLLFKKVGDKTWQEVPMNPIMNDRWTGTFIPKSTGFYEYTILAYIDHYASWQYGLRKKFEAGQDISVEMLIGAEMLEKMAKQCQGSDQKKLKEYAKSFRDTSAENIEVAVARALSDEATQLATKCVNRSHATHYHQTVNVEVERKKALFSTWYEFFPRSTAREEGKHGNFQTAAKILPRVAEMGFDVVYLPPIHPIGKKHRKGLNNALSANPGDTGSCWAIGSDEGGHKDIHPELGTMKDFQDFV